MIDQFILGIYVKLIAGLDDTITHVPIIASITRAWHGRVAFGFGVLMAVLLAVLVAAGFSSLLRHTRWYKWIAVGLVFGLAIMLLRNGTMHRPREAAEKQLPKRISPRHLFLLTGTGFVAGIATVIDDIVAYVPLFLGSAGASVMAAAGIMTGAVIEVTVAAVFTDRLAHIPHKEKIASAGLALYGVLLIAS